MPRRRPRIFHERVVSAIESMIPGTLGGRVSNASPVDSSSVRAQTRGTVSTVTQVQDSPIEDVNTVAASGSTETLPDVDEATMHRVTLTANCTFTFPTAVAGKSFSLELVQDGTGSRTATWPGTVKWAGGTAPALSTATGKIDDFAFVCFDGTHWSGFFAGKGMA